MRRHRGLTMGTPGRKRDRGGRSSWQATWCLHLAHLAVLQCSASAGARMEPARLHALQPCLLRTDRYDMATAAGATTDMHLSLSETEAAASNGQMPQVEAASSAWRREARVSHSCLPRVAVVQVRSS